MKGQTMSGQNKSLPNTDTCENVTDETILKIAKEVTVKFIEVGRVTPSNFSSAFTNIYKTIEITVRGDKS
jgi:hypothetical protein